MVVQRFDIWLVESEQRSDHSLSPHLIISPDELNRHLRIVLAAPLTRSEMDYPTRINCTLGDQSGQIALEELTALPQTRLSQRIAVLPESLQSTVLERLQELFAQ